MKVVIIGGGIGGLAIGAFLYQKGVEIVINERSVNTPEGGHAFLMHPDGGSVLGSLRQDELSRSLRQVSLRQDELSLPGRTISRFTLKRPSGEVVRDIPIDSWKCIKRGDLVLFLSSLLPGSVVKTGRCFSHFLYAGDRVTAAVFSNGETEYGDLFIGSDGGHSRVRESLFGPVDMTPVTVKEIVGIAANVRLAKTLPASFLKFQDSAKGLAFGMIPSFKKEFVWFMQYDPSIGDLAGTSPQEIEGFCRHMLRDFPGVVDELLRGNDFAKTYIWNTRDFDLLPSFHHKNVVLLGDAAHLALPFTSAGTTNALIDAKTLSDCLEAEADPEMAFAAYYQARAGEVGQHILLGRELKRAFLDPGNAAEGQVRLPFIGDQAKEQVRLPFIGGTDEQGRRAAVKRIRVSYFTDPICSTCWIIQPLLKKLELEYGRYLDFRYYMGGLLKSWPLEQGSIRTPSDAARHWDEVGAFYEMPLDGDVWHEDPLFSSFPPSIAFKAAQMQDAGKAALFLRRIREMVFLEKKNIIKWRFLARAAQDVGLDPIRLLKDFRGPAKADFEHDLQLAKRMHITSFPTLIFSAPSAEPVTLKGYQLYDKFEAIIHGFIPLAKKEAINAEPQSLFTHFPTLAEKEFAFLSNMFREDAIKVLQELNDGGYLEKLETKNGTLWKNRFAW
jgi:2-polyprenyl-6-methoxyphenol hydroxylase-like FAD-dependent oxidoreductase/predicted DsbA family dithiol-disulfide isomerase